VGHLRQVRDLELGRVIRAIRRRRGWRQLDCAIRAGVHRSSWSQVERGQIDGMTVITLRRCLAVLEIRLDLRPQWRGAELDRLLDAGHAALQATWTDRLQKRAWVVWVERSYSIYGERGRIDLLAWHAATRTMLVIELKTELADAQALLGTLDAKARLAPVIARELGLPPPTRVVRMIVFEESMTNRRRVDRLSTLFSSFETRGSAALAWLHNPKPSSGLLIFSAAAGSSTRGAQRQRVSLGTSSRARIG
jgi:transcriptional regulator with XRE-family HTH domain